MRGTERAFAALIGLGVLLGTAWWVRASLNENPAYAYGMQWFLGPGPGEVSAFLPYLGAGAAGVLALAYGLAPRFARIPGPAVRWTGRGPAIALALIASALVSGVGFGLLGDQVVTDDERVYLFQAEALGRGQATFPAPEMGEFLENVFIVVREGRWFGQYPPGHPALLSLVLWTHLPRLLPILLAGINVLLTIAVVRRVAGPGMGLLAGALLCLSPLFLLTGATLLSHPSAYTALALGCLGAVTLARGGHAAWGAASGLGLGFLFLIRPYTAITLGLVPGVVLLVSCWRQRRPAPVLAGLAVLAVSGVAFLLYNHAVTGDPFLTGYEAIRTGTAREFGFGTIVAGFHDHTPLQGLRNIAVLAGRHHLWILGWPLTLVPMLLALGPGATSAERSARLGARLACGMLLVGALSYVPYWAIGVNDTGPVKTYEWLLPSVFLTALGLRGLARRVGTGFARGWMAASALAAILVFWPPQLTHLRSVVAAVEDPLELVRSEVEPNALVFVSNVQPPVGRCWVYGRPVPRPDLSDPILYVRDLGEKNLAFWRIHSDRTPYRLEWREDRFQVLPLRVRRR